MRIGIFGGTFDPPHVGHLLAAGDAAEALALDRIVFVPAAEQPLKRGTIEASAEARLEMVRRLAGDDARFEVDPVEIERGGLSFMVDTLRAFRERWRDDGDLALFLLLGADAVASLPKWREPDVVTALAEVVTLMRADGGESSPAGVRRVTTRRVDVSSTEIRARVRAGKSIHGFVPDAVAEYIVGHRLYR
jgi:nicotinate-nucleotide adenylyltransferase